jgi:hypothetical protein
MMYPNDMPTTAFAERHGRVASIPAFYLAGPGFKCRPGDKLFFLTKDFRGFPQYFQANAVIVLHITTQPLPFISFQIRY